MATALRSTLEKLVRDFANDVLGTLRTASLSDLASETGRGAPAPRAAGYAVAASSTRGPKPRGKIKLRRRSAKAISGVVGRVVALLHSQPGLRAEQIRAKLGLAQNELPRPIAQALTDGKISKTGVKRATKYFAGKRAAGGGGGVAKKRSRRRRGKKK